jgi:hypothetical protein
MDKCFACGENGGTPHNYIHFAAYFCNADCQLSFHEAMSLDATTKKKALHAFELGLPIGEHHEGSVHVTVAPYEDKDEVLFINGEAMMNDNVYVTRSLIPGAEWGLFANRDFKRGTQILEYKGRLITGVLPKKELKEVMERGYLIKFGENTMAEERRKGSPYQRKKDPIIGIEAYPYVDEDGEAMERIGGFANGGEGARVNAQTYEVTYMDAVYEDGEPPYRLYMYASKYIPEGGEILWDYGKGYWINRVMG